MMLFHFQWFSHASDSRITARCLCRPGSIPMIRRGCSPPAQEHSGSDRVSCHAFTDFPLPQRHAGHHVVQVARETPSWFFVFVVVVVSAGGHMGPGVMLVVCSSVLGLMVDGGQGVAMPPRGGGFAARMERVARGLRRRKRDGEFDLWFWDFCWCWSISATAEVLQPLIFRQAQYFGLNVLGESTF